MKETALWNKLRDPLSLLGKFQKTSDRFTPGIPDVLGCFEGVGWAIELKEMEGVRSLKIKFRPLQLEWLRDWEKAGGVSFVMVSYKREIHLFRWQDGEELESGVTPERMAELSVFHKEQETYFEFCERILTSV